MTRTKFEEYLTFFVWYLNPYEMNVPFLNKLNERAVAPPLQILYASFEHKVMCILNLEFALCIELQ